MATESKGGGCQRRYPHFFKVFLPGLTSEKLEIPPGFRKHMEADLRSRALPGFRKHGEADLGSCALMGPSGNIWTVALVRSRAGGLFLTDGWKEFARDHAMETGEFIVFVYYGAAQFRLLIFDTTACEKLSAFRASPSQIAGAGEEGDAKDGQKETSTEGLTAVATPEASTEAAAYKPRRKWSRRKEECGEGQPHAAGCMLQIHCEAGAGGGGAPEGGAPRAGTPKRTYARKNRSRGLLVSQRRPVTKEEIERAHRAAWTFASENPCQVVIMRRSFVYVGHSVPLPHTFARTYLPKAAHKIILSDTAGKRWTVTYLPLDGTYILSAGWRQFSLDNHLEQDDAIVLELIGEGEILVHIFRIVEEVRPLIRTIMKV